MQDPKVVARARSKVWKQAVEGLAKTPAMRDTPSRRRSEPALTGAWPRFPVSPRGPYEVLGRSGGSGRASRPVGDDGSGGCANRVAAGLVEATGGDRARLLAVRRAALACGVRALQVCVDSCGALGGWLQAGGG